MNPDQDQQDPQPMPTPMPTQPPEQPTSPSIPSPTPEVAPLTNEVPAPSPNPFSSPTSPSTEPAPAPTPEVAPLTNEVLAPAPTTGGSSKKKLIIILSAVIGGLLIIGGVAAAAYFLLFSVSKEDYQQAYDQMNVISQAINDSEAAPDSNSEDDIAKANAAYEKYKTENAKLGDMKAIKYDAEVNEKYKAYDAKADAFIIFMDSFLPSYAAFIDASKSMESFSMTSADVQDAIKAYESAEEKATDPTIKTYLDSSIAAFNKMLPELKIYEDKSSSSSARQAASSKLNSISLELVSAVSTLVNEIRNRGESVSPNASFDELHNLVSQKLNEA